MSEHQTVDQVADTLFRSIEGGDLASLAPRQGNRIADSMVEVIEAA